MNKVRVLVVEDEVIIADDLCDSLNELGYDALDPVGTYGEAVTVIENEYPDIAILDIQLSGKKNGIELAHEINQTYKIPFIFLTSNSDKITLDDAKKAEPFAYLVKPFNQKDLYTTIELALYNFAKRKEQLLDQDKLIIKDALFIKDQKIFHRINFDDILYIKSDHVYVEIKTQQKSITVRAGLNHFMDKLNQQFFRCHRSYVINLNYLQGVNHNTVDIENESIPLGKKQREDLIAKLNRV